MEDPVITLIQEHSNNHDSATWPMEIGRLATKLSETREQLSTTIGNARVESYSKFCELSTEIVKLTQGLENLSAAYEKTQWKIKFGASILAVSLAITGYLGFHYGYLAFYRDVKETVTQKMETEIRRGVISEDRTFYEDLVAGNALDAAGKYTQATARLLECFKEGHYTDSAVLVPLLDSIYHSEDWESAKAVVDVLEKENPHMGEISDHTVLAYIGSIEVQAGGLYQEWKEEGFTLLQRAQLLAPADDTATLSMIHANYWLYYLQRQDWKSAEEEISALKQLDVPVSTWDSVRRWRFIAGYFGQSGNVQFETRIRTMWSELPHRVGDE